MLSPLNADRFAKPTSMLEPGPAPMLQWIEVNLLVVDHLYQRTIGRRGGANVARIAECFDWSKFAPVIVAPVEGGQYAVVDGQHRTTAAMLRGFEKVPCQVVQADRAQQAAAYAAVNGNVTKTTHTQLFHARMAAGDETAKAVAAVCLSAGVSVVRSNKTLAALRAGETTATGALVRCYNLYGAPTLQTALRCITQTAEGNAGFLRPTVIEGLCMVLTSHPDWLEPEDMLLKHMESFSFPDAWEAISGGRDQIFPNTAKTDMAQRVEKHLARKYAQNNRKQVAAPARVSAS